MSNIKLSALPEISSTGLTTNTIFASVDSGSTTTSKVSLGNLFRNDTSLINDENPGNYNVFIAGGSSTNSPTFGSEFRGNTRNSLIVGNGVINNATDSAVINSVEASGGNWTGIDGGSVHFVASAFRSRITGGQECFIGGSQDANINNVYDGGIIGCAGSTMNGGPAFMGGNQGGTINSNRAVMLGSESSTLNSNMSGIYNSYATTAAGNLYQVSLGSFQGTIDSVGGAGENMLLLGTRDTTNNNQGDSMITTSGRTSIYDRTLHTDNLYSFGRIQTSTSSGTSINNEQFLTGGLGMVQYTTIDAGNLNLKINDVRNGEVYHWVINNDTGGSVSVNSVATNTGFSITDNSANSVSTGRHIFTIVIVDDHIVIEGNH